MGDNDAIAVDEPLWGLMTRVFAEAAELIHRSPDAGPLPMSFVEAVDALEGYWRRQTMSATRKTVNARHCRLLTSACAEAVALGHRSPDSGPLPVSFLEAIRTAERHQHRRREAA